MKNIRHLFLMFIFLIFPLKGYAICNDETKSLYDKYKDEFRITSRYDRNTNLYEVTFYNPLPDSFRFEYDPNFNTNDCKNGDENTLICNYISLNEYLFYIYGITSSCSDIVGYNLLNVSYNVFATDSLCEGIEEFVLCDPTYDKEIDYDTFYSRVNTYKKSKAEEKAKEEIEPKVNKFSVFWEDTKEFLLDNLFIIITCIVGVIILIILIISIVKSYKRRWRLE